MDTVRKQKSGDQLTVGDWLAPEQVTDGAAEVLHVLAYRPDNFTSRDTEKHVHLVVREQGRVAPYTDIVAGGTLFDLATEADLAAMHKQAEREQLANELRQLAAMIADPAMPVPQYGISMYASFKTGAEVRAAAEVFSLPVESRKPNAGIQTPEWPEGRKSYEQGVHLHWLTIADEPEPERCEVCGESLREIERGTLGHILGEACAPVDDPTGLTYTRADDEPEGDVTQQLGHRIEPHVGAVTEQGLVDETERPMCAAWCADGPGGLCAKDIGHGGDHGSDD